MIKEKVFLFSFLIFLIFPPSILTSSNISVILEHCFQHPECYESTIDQFSVTYRASLVKLLSSGVNQFLWEYVSEGNKFPETISSSCEMSLRHTWTSVKKGQEWAFRSKF